MNNENLLKEFNEMFAPWDMADYITTPEDVYWHIKVALEDDDPKHLLKVLGNVARSKGMAQVAKQLGVTRECLYTSLSAKGNPSYKTVVGALKAFGFELTLKPTETVTTTHVKKSAKKKTLRRTAAPPKPTIRTKRTRKLAA